MKRARPRRRSRLDLALVLTTSLCLCESVLSFSIPSLRQRSPALRKAAVQDVVAPPTSHAPPQLQPVPSPPTRIVERDFVVYRRPEAYDPLKGRRFIGSLRNFLQRVRDVIRDEREAKASGRKPSISRFVRACMEEKKYLAISTVALVGAAMCEVAVPHYSSKALNAILVTKKIQDFTTSVQAVVLLGLGASFFTFLRAAFFGLAGTRVTARSRIKLFKNLLSQELGFYDATDTGELTNRLSADATRFYNVLASHFNVMLRQAIQAVGGSIFLYRIHPPLATVTLVGIFAMAVMTTLHGTFIRRVGRRSQDALAKANAVAGQILGLIRVVRCHGSEERELIRYGAALETTVNQLEGHDLGHAVYRSLVRVLQTFIQAVVMGVGSVLTLQGHMTGEQLTSFLFYTGFVGAASSDVGDRWGSIQDAVGSTQAVLSLMDRKSSLVVREDLRLRPSMNTTYDDAVSLTHQGHGAHKHHTTHGSEQEYNYGAIGGHVDAAQKGARVSFVNVSFTYPLRRSPVLHDFNLEIPPGQRTAIVGGSGAGKSTLMRLLCRFYDADSGAVLLDGKDLRGLTQDELTTKIAFLPQEPQLLPQISIADNIGYGLPPGSFTMDDIVRAAREANVHNFISSLPHGYDTIVDEGAATLSGGQKQRISVARALIRKPELLLLDEPTSALDVKSEAVVQEALNLASTGRTVVIIAHRLSTIKDVENIVVMQGGRIVEMGSHEDLMRIDNGVYASMVQLAAGERVY